MSEQIWNFGAIQALVAEIHGDVGTTAGLLDEGKGSLATLASVWGGIGSESYQAVQMRWDTTSLELNNALQNLAHTMDEATAVMMTTEKTVTGYFG
ncbi:6 kDa early secretory antigenic target EsaT6 [Mycolicibacterium phlei]|jgi:early secretory antigenic target protein ESAT-6|uniref:ESAT-6-like protein n=1 Tax=Mycolicibacterium phlei DSM 43239 = CCUG 21000 TaxID=1226750 RepID=A0A5N5UY59_MYCPH|nr:WXG100 family type VII secretion target [Mycolicibacterium phlei]VEG07027.1 6 kDa early secretory antigenic target EsaT6 [Mycobacteroides chelonae]AMO58895.1 6 kDa early secretory antigenic target [Mycolicibacterium phlei]EID09391.1 early secretory antigenic target, 6 kDa [Mycolicibacterium phlei RIVM601174]KAB7754573.1 hypothetical protein MPHL21000_15605 [Mycolicibacterium phlei DSM 43239 = CCUG 21000]KXW59935.1 hypothetical protein MPHL43070_07370 [Mycolicibacterium phlei DSM 43070]